jgi:hypothetical protein
MIYETEKTLPLEAKGPTVMSLETVSAIALLGSSQYVQVITRDPPQEGYQPLNAVATRVSMAVPDGLVSLLDR